ncbi:putative ABC transporter integral membrane protein [Sorangium cellulosum So ce56]|uniref:ABC transporter integral membrane protein n=1 Tax=Sorangium cellulosum (strain So ce56) TaxID=448385 RepID=A9G015_SORC5|nr:FtsX-like permease family protein [Sorangium cellulosum]CAN98812.1 putative ABC transporter integral membrane protein [Sorangium cellulosum So ce56]
MLLLLRALFQPLVRILALRNLRADRFGAMAAVLGVALGTATVNVVLILDVGTRAVEARSAVTNPDLPVFTDQTITLRGLRPDGQPIDAEDAQEETHEDYEIMRSAIRLGSLSAFLVGALIVFFTFNVAVERRRREIALLRSAGALPPQVAAVFVLEALLLGAFGAALGLLGSIPLAYLAAKAGITTTGRARIPLNAIVLPWSAMLLVCGTGALTALLGVLRPVRDALRLDIARALRPRFVEGGAEQRRRMRGVTLLALPFMVLVYGLLRPFFQESVPLFAFFVLEAGLACAAFLAAIVFVPDLVARLGALAVRLAPRRWAAERLLLRRRVEHSGHELAWSVGGVMMVFALLLALHIATAALKQEVTAWAGRALAPYAFLYPDEPLGHAERLLPRLPERLVAARFSSRTPWPNVAYAVPADELLALAEATGREESIALARRFGPGKALVSTMMARRFGVGPGDQLEVGGRAGTRRLEVVGITDELGYVHAAGAYRNLRTYAVIDASDFPVISPYATAIGHTIALADPQTGAAAARGGSATPPWAELLADVPRARDVRMQTGVEIEAIRRKATGRDFVIFDMILGFTTVLAAIGVANQMVLALHARRRELALHRVLGMTAGQVRRMVLMEGALVGALGGALAVLLGIPLGSAALGALRTVSTFEVEFHIPPEYGLFTALGATAVALLASLYPARSAGRSNAAESVHYE